MTTTTTTVPTTTKKKGSTATATDNQATATQEQIPYLQQTNQNQLVPLTAQAQQVQTPSTGNQAVLNTAQQAVTTQENPANEYLNALVSQKSAELLEDPNQGLDVSSYKQNLMDQFNRSQSQAMEAARQKLGATSQSGELQNEFLKNALYGAQQRADLSSQTDYDLSNLQKQNLIDALAAGREGVSSASDAYTAYINNLATVGGMAEGQEERTFEERMAILEAELESAEADKDVERQKEILQEEAKLKLTEMEEQYGYDAALTTLQGDIDKAISEGDHAATAALQKEKLEYQVNRDVQDFALQEMALDLEAKQVDVELVASQYENMLNTYGQEAADEFMANTLAQNGIDVAKYNIVDRQEQAIKALQEEYELITVQFAATHPEYVGDDGNLTEEGLAKFNDYYNYTMYGEESEEMKEEERTAGWITNPAELSNAVAGDMVKLDEALTTTMGVLDGYGQIPAGEYSVVEEPVSSGSKFFGTAEEWVDTYLVSASGNKYRIKSGPKGAVGNVVSNLWAGDV